MNKQHSYVDATAICKLHKKRPNDWLCLYSVKRIIDDISLKTGLPVEALVQVRAGQPTSGGGTLIHESLLTHLSNWLNNSATIVPRNNERDELKFASMLQAFFYDRVVLKQVSCFDGKYFIDFLIDFVAIEYDEPYHRGERQTRKDFIRQKEIEEHYGYRFIRIPAGKEIVSLRRVYDLLGS